jgi:hypothetical protein
VLVHFNDKLINLFLHTLYLALLLGEFFSQFFAILARHWVNLSIRQRFNTPAIPDQNTTDLEDLEVRFKRPSHVNMISPSQRGDQHMANEKELLQAILDELKTLNQHMQNGLVSNFNLIVEVRDAVHQIQMDLSTRR